MGWQKDDKAKRMQYNCKQQQYKVKKESRLNELVFNKCTNKNTAMLLSLKKALKQKITATKKQ